MAATTNTTHQNRAFALVFGGCGFSLVATTTTAHQLTPTTAENEHECSISVVVGFFWPPPPQLINHPHILRNRAFVLVVGFLGCCHQRQPINQPPQLPKSNVCARFRRLWASFAAAIPPPINQPPQLPKSSICTRLQWLWTFLACRHYDQLSTTPTTAEIERPRSFSAVVDFPGLPPLRPTINHPPQPPKSSADARCVLSLPAATTNHQPPHNRRNQASAPVPGASRLSLPIECTPNIHHAAKSSTARFCCSMGHT